jgi:CRISPR/Cas system-associated exonuclease Cas4 (RecB family)
VSECLKIVNKVVNDSCDEKNFNPLINEDFVSNLKNDVTKFIPTTVSIIREHKLLKPKSRSEVDLSVEYKSKSHGVSLKIAGRSDFVHEPDSIWIIDGKGSVHRERYVDSEQLIWYAVQYYLKYHVAPDRLGFLYYRFPEDPIQWIVYDENSMRSNLLKTFDTAVKILNKEFDAIPSTNCNRCEFSKFCDEGHKFLAAKRASNIIVVPDSTFGFDDVIS